MSLTIAQLFIVSVARSKRWHDKQEPWSRNDWLVAVLGELGEAANASKKLRRIETGAPNINLEAGRQLSGDAEAKQQILVEIADFILYVPSLVAQMGFTATEFEQALRDKFNLKSEEYGFPERL